MPSVQSLTAGAARGEFSGRGIGSMMALLSALLLALFHPFLLYGQQPDSTSAEASYLMRMQRIQRSRDTCVLVRGDGQYHLESDYFGKVSIFEGDLSPGDLGDLFRMLSNDRLFELRQKDIRIPLLAVGGDELILAIHRHGSWQNLSFPDAESRNPFREVLDPLLNFFELIEKAKGRRLTEEEGKNNCQVPGELRLKQRPTDNAAEGSIAAGSDQVSTSSPYLMRMFTTQIVVNWQNDSSCLIVFETGIYRRVHQWVQAGSNKRESTVADGRLAPEDLRSLRAILDDDRLQKYAPADAPHPTTRWITERHLLIPRNGTVQQITTWRYFAGGAAMTPIITEHGTKELKPLDDWLKVKIPSDKEVKTQDPENVQCLAVH